MVEKVKKKTGPKPRSLPKLVTPSNVSILPLGDGKFYETRIRVKYPHVAEPFEVSIQGIGNSLPSDRELERGWGPEQRGKGLYETQAHLNIAKLIVHGLTRKVQERVQRIEIHRNDAKFNRLQEFVKDAYAEMRRIEAENPRFYVYDMDSRDFRKQRYKEAKDRVDKADFVVMPIQRQKFKILKDFITGQEWQEISLYHLSEILHLYLGSKVRIDNYFHLQKSRDKDGRWVYKLGDPKY